MNECVFEHNTSLKKLLLKTNSLMNDDIVNLINISYKKLFLGFVSLADVKVIS